MKNQVQVPTSSWMEIKILHSAVEIAYWAYSFYSSCLTVP